MNDVNVAIAECPIKLTSGAMDEVRKLINEKEVPVGYALRIGVKGGGCSGFSYLLGFDKPGEKDQVFEMDGVQVVMEKAHGLYLAGMEVDYVDNLENRGFVFNNPNADSTCGCGTSFSA